MEEFPVSQPKGEVTGHVGKGGGGSRGSSVRAPSPAPPLVGSRCLPAPPGHGVSHPAPASPPVSQDKSWERALCSPLMCECTTQVPDSLSCTPTTQKFLRVFGRCSGLFQTPRSLHMLFPPSGQFFLAYGSVYFWLTPDKVDHSLLCELT